MSKLKKLFPFLKKILSSFLFVGTQQFDDYNDIKHHNECRRKRTPKTRHFQREIFNAKKTTKKNARTILKMSNQWRGGGIGTKEATLNIN